MKFRPYILTVFFSLVLKTSPAQLGLFLTAPDFVDQKISYTGAKIKLHELFKKDEIEIRTKDSVFSLNKKDLFGYVDKEGAYRFYKQEALLILNPAEKILLYKRTSGNGLKNSPLIDTYYFSISAAAPVQLLTLDNFEKAFVGNMAFIKSIEQNFSSDQDLLQYDKIHRAFKINRLLALTQ